MDSLPYLHGNEDNFGKHMHIVTPFHGLVYGYNESISRLNATISPIHQQCDLSDTGSIGNICYTILMVIILSASVVGNSLVILATLISKQLKNRVTWYFIVSLAMSDLLFAVFNIPFHISSELHKRFCHSIAACYLQIYTDLACNVASVLNLLLISIDRFIAIKMPFRYQSLLTKCRAKVLIALVWIFALCWAFIGLFKWDTETINETNNIQAGTFSIQLSSYYCSNRNYYYYAATFIAIFILPLCIITTTYIMILHIALIQIKAIESTHVELQILNQTTLMSPDYHNDKTRVISRKNSSNRKRDRELKATKSVAIVYFAFLLCWFPNCVINLIIMFDAEYFPNLKKRNKVMFNFVVYCFIQILPMVNTMVNPIIYSFSNKQFQKAFKDVFSTIRKKFDNSNDSFKSTPRRSTNSAYSLTDHTDRFSVPARSIVSS